MDYEAFADVVKHFDKTFKCKEDFALRRKLIVEEYREFVAAYKSGDRKAAAKELADVLFVVIGAFDTLFSEEEIQAALMQVAGKNWRKCEAAGEMVVREDGKIVKPTGDSRFV